MRDGVSSWQTDGMPRKPTIEIIDVRGLPEPVVATLKAVVDAVRREVPEAPTRRSARGQGLRVFEGRVKGKLTRREIYDDVG